MRRLMFIAGATLVALSLLIPGAQAARKLRVVATIPDLKSLVEAVGGDLVEVDVLTRGTENFPEAVVRPSMVLKVRRGAALIVYGAEVGMWAGVGVLVAY